MRVGQVRKRDSNEPAIRKALSQIGVQTFPQSGEGTPDLLTFTRGCWGVLEVKMPGEKLTQKQQQVYATAPFPIVESVAEALAVFGVKA